MKNLNFMLIFFATLLIESNNADVQSDLIEFPLGFRMDTFAKGVRNSVGLANVIYRISYTK